MTLGRCDGWEDVREVGWMLGRCDFWEDVRGCGCWEGVREV